MRCLQFLVQSLRVWLAFYETMANSHVKKMVVISEALYKTLTNMQSTSRFKSNTEFSNMQDNIEGLDRLRQEKENLLAEDDDDDDDNEEKNEEGEEFLKSRLYKKLKKLTSKKLQSQIVALAERILNESTSQITPRYVALGSSQYSILNFCDLLKLLISQRKPDLIQNYGNFLSYLHNIAFPMSYINNSYVKSGLRDLESRTGSSSINAATSPFSLGTPIGTTIKTEVSSPLTSRSGPSTSRGSFSDRFGSPIRYTGREEGFSDVEEGQEQDDDDDNDDFETSYNKLVEKNLSELSDAVKVLSPNTTWHQSASEVAKTRRISTPIAPAAGFSNTARVPAPDSPIPIGRQLLRTPPIPIAQRTPIPVGRALKRTPPQPPKRKEEEKEEEEEEEEEGAKLPPRRSNRARSSKY